MKDKVCYECGKIFKADNKGFCSTCMDKINKNWQKYGLRLVEVDRTNS